jgi:ATP-binding cassette subfamily B protein
VEIIKIASQERQAIVLSLILAVLTVALGFTTSVLTQKVLDGVIPHHDLRVLYLLGFGALAVTAFRTVGLAVRQVILAYLGCKIEMSLCLPFLRHVLSLPLEFFEKRATGDIFSRANDASRISAAVSGSLVSTIPDSLFLIVFAVLLVWYSARLTLVILCFMPAIAVLVLLFFPSLVSKEREIKEHMSEWANRFIESLQGIKTLKAFTSESFAYSRMEGPYVAMQKGIRERFISSQVLGVLCSFFTSSAAIVLLIVGTRSILEGNLTTGQMMFFCSASGLFLGAVDRLCPSIITLQEALVAVERLREITATRSENKGQGEVSDFSGEGEGAIEFRDVAFGYSSRRRVLSGITLTVHPGEWVAILGETGSGKTTLANLLLGLYQPSDGDILVDGVSVGSLQSDLLRRHVAIVFQEAGLMSGSIQESISLGSAEATFEQVQQAAKLACIHEFIMGLPKKYEQNVGPFGTMLSSGQRQRIAIARALLRDAPIMVFDEATSNLDLSTERRVLENIQKVRRGKTTLIITHRLPSALLADSIVVLDSGTMVEKGTHDELIRTGGKYCSLWSAMGSMRADLHPYEKFDNVDDSSVLSAVS